MFEELLQRGHSCFGSLHINLLIEQWRAVDIFAQYFGVIVSLERVLNCV